MTDRNYILNIIKSKDMTIDEFNYEKLSCPPISYYFSQYDLQRLYEIATSLRYSAKPQVRYQEIDKIMKSRGFVKLSAGTNRVVYRCINDDTFVAKVASDAVGLGDNPKEFINQQYLKPFCAKTFEVAGYGVIAFSERLNPITNREEFISVAEDIFTLIDEFIIDGEYIMDDIGSKYFMNYGFRKGFGPAILDLATLYKLDGNKLYCNRPDPTTETKTCGGLIDYDDGFNNLVCKKCGKIYRAKDLELKVKNNDIITKSFKREFNKMKVKVSGGTKNYDVTTVVENFTVEEPKKNETPTVYADKKTTVKVSLGGHKEDTPVRDNIIRAHVVNNTPKIAKEEPKTENVTPVVEEKKEEIKEEKPVIKTSPIKVTETVKEDTADIKDTFFEVAKLISGNEITGKFDAEKADSVISGLKFVIETVRGTNIWNSEFEAKLFSIIVNDKDVTPEGEEIEEDGSKFFRVNFKSDDDVIYSYEHILNTVIEEDVDNTEDVEPAKEIESEATESIEEYVTEDTQFEPIEEDESEDQNVEIPLTGFELYSAKMIDISSKISTAESKQVLVVEDGYGQLLTIGENGNLFVIDRINGIDTSEAEVVSKAFVTNILKETEEKAVELTKDTFKEEVSVNNTVNGVPEEVK